MGQEPDKCPKEGPGRSLGGAVLHAAVSPQQLEALLTARSLVTLPPGVWTRAAGEQVSAFEGSA